VKARSRTLSTKYDPKHDPASIRSVEIAFLDKNKEVLLRNYAGKWIVVEDESVVSSGESLLTAGARAREAGVLTPFIVYIDEPDSPPFVG
jgi:hypothetical protein